MVAEKANKAKSELLAKVSHELRTPLGAILGHTEMLQEEIYGPITKEQDHTLTRIIENSGYLNEQVNDLLDLSRIDTGTLDIQLYVFDLKDALEQVRHRLQPAAEAKNLDFLITVASGFPRQIMGNSIRFQQILVNLCNNAIKFTEKGFVHVKIGMLDADFWQIIVSDSGKGIPQNELTAIFQPFHQLGNSMIQSNSGVGLGLTIVHELVVALGGKVEVESEPNVGSIFSITLPVDPVQNSSTQKVQNG